jgi:hypothetical protein
MRVCLRAVMSRHSAPRRAAIAAAEAGGMGAHPPRRGFGGGGARLRLRQINYAAIGRGATRSGGSCHRPALGRVAVVQSDDRAGRVQHRCRDPRPSGHTHAIQVVVNLSTHSTRKRTGTTHPVAHGGAEREAQSAEAKREGSPNMGSPPISPCAMSSSLPSLRCTDSCRPASSHRAPTCHRQPPRAHYWVAVGADP